MIKNVIETGSFLGKYTMPSGHYPSLTRLIDFEATVETANDNIVSMSIVVCYCENDNSTGKNILSIPCSTNFEFEVEGEVKASELEPLWKRAVKNLRDKCNDTKNPHIKDIPYPPNDMVRTSVNDFLNRWAASPEKEEGEI